MEQKMTRGSREEGGRGGMGEIHLGFDAVALEALPDIDVKGTRWRRSPDEVIALICEGARVEGEECAYPISFSGDVSLDSPYPTQPSFA
jgi:hypothetical protein